RGQNTKVLGECCLVRERLRRTSFEVPLVVSLSIHKECTVSLQRYYARCYSKNDTMSIPVSLTRYGIPKIIPTVLKKHVRAKPDHGDYLIAVVPKVKKATFQSITTPHSDIDSVREVLGEMKTS
ncbi:hypothetical protein H5410_056582, partial [Solanum commersonii]